MSKPFENRFSQPWKNSDVKLVADGESFHCHRAILELNSPVLAAMFQNDFKEAQERKANLPGKDKNIFIFFLNAMYPLMETRDEKQYEFNFLCQVLDYAKEYLAESVSLAVDQLLANQIVRFKSDRVENFKACIEYLLVADLHKLKKARLECFLYISSLKRPFGNGLSSIYAYEETSVKKLPIETQHELLLVELRKIGLPDIHTKDVPVKTLEIKLSGEEQRNLNYILKK